MTAIAIAGVGLVTARGNASELGTDRSAEVPMPWHPSRMMRAARGADGLEGHARLAAMMRSALAECGGTGPILAASCNGGASSRTEADWRTSFELPHSPVASAACVSGLHALLLARRLIEAGAPEVRVVAADLVTAPAHDNFESLRVLADDPAPFQPESNGFLLGEAAVALRIVPAASAPDAPRLIGPILGHDLDGDDGLVRVLAAFGAHRPELVIGQGAGPVAGDMLELDALARDIDRDVPLTTALHGFGHTLGASSLLSVALAVLARETALPALRLPYVCALDGRRLGASRSQRTIIACRALGGGCGACFVGDDDEVALHPGWGPRSPAPPLRDPTLRAIAAAATRERPHEPPELVIVTLEAPLVPAARSGNRILPTSVLEMTPGAIPQLIARSWGFTGPALCLVGGDPAAILAACRRTQRVFHVAIQGMDQRHVEWNA